MPAVVARKSAVSVCKHFLNRCSSARLYTYRWVLRRRSERMAHHPLLDFIHRLRRARSVAEGDHLSDAQLLQRSAQQRDEAAFEVLVWRHGTMVLNVAQRLLHQSADAEDVFQATFLTLARKASAIRRGTSVGSWLYKVAYRIALRVRRATTRREQREQSGVENVAATAPAGRDEMETAVLVADEVSRLPERYRA